MELNTNVTPVKIKKAYYKLALNYHPDKGGDENKFKALTWAYNLLTKEPAKLDKFMYEIAKKPKPQQPPYQQPSYQPQQQRPQPPKPQQQSYQPQPPYPQQQQPPPPPQTPPRNDFRHHTSEAGSMPQPYPTPRSARNYAAAAAAAAAATAKEAKEANWVSPQQRPVMPPKTALMFHWLGVNPPPRGGSRKQIRNRKRKGGSKTRRRYN